MSGYLLCVKAGDKVLAQGTAWLLRPDLAVTAFHVVGTLPARAWLHEIPGVAAAVTYTLRAGAQEIALDPVVCDLGADVAMLRCRESLAAPQVLSLLDAAPEKGASFEAQGYPAFRRGAPFTVTGRITEVRGEVSSTALQLLFDQGTDATWQGLSGSAVQVGSRVAGVVTNETANVATGWAASFEAVGRLESFLAAAGELGGAVRELLQKLYAEAEDLLDLRAELGWPAEVGSGGDRGAAAAVLSARAMLDGADGLLRLLNAMGHDHPANGDVEQLRARVLSVVRRREMAGRSRGDRVREIVQWLRDPNRGGVAVLAPQGFQGRVVVEEVLRQLDKPGEALLPVRFVPERRTAGDERLYTTLLRDLRWAMPEEWRGVLDARRDASAMDRFEYGVDDLLTGPAREARRTLLFVIEGLDRVPADQLQQWGYLLARLSPRGLRLLVWGGERLHGLMKREASEDFSAFHVLKEERLGELSLNEVRDMVVACGGDEAAARVLYRETGGHPALVEELLRDHPEDAIAGDREALERRIVDGAHVGGLRRMVEGDPTLQRVLRALATVEGEALPRGGKTRKAEVRLSWLGVLKDAGAKSWGWVAPAMRVFAGEW